MPGGHCLLLKQRKYFRDSIGLRRVRISTNNYSLEMQAPLNAGVSYKQDFDAIYAEVATREKFVVSSIYYKRFISKSRKQTP